MSWQLTEMTAPTVKPLTLDEVRQFVQVAPSVDHALLMALVDTATAYIENETERQLCAATWKLELPYFPAVIRLPRPPLSSLTSVQYLDANGSTQTVDSSVYTTLDDGDGPARIVQAYGQSWPTGLYGVDYPVIVNYVAGYTTVPEKLKTALKIVVKTLYEGRESGLDMPLAVASLCYMCRHGTIYGQEVP